MTAIEHDKLCIGHDSNDLEDLCVRVLCSAALVAACSAAIFVRIQSGRPTVLAAYDRDQTCDLGAAKFAVDCSTKLQPHPTWVSQGGEAYVATVAVCDHAGEALGALLLWHVGREPNLSAAQRYVLTTHATHLATLVGIEKSRLDLNGKPCTSGDERLRLLESVVVNANDAVLITEAQPIDLPGPRIVYCNRAFELTTGYTEAEVLGKTPRILQSTSTDRGALATLKEALANWRPVTVELLNCRKDGTEFWVELSIVPVADEKGWFTHWVSVQREVSDRKKAEEVAVRVRIAEARNQALAGEISERRKVEAQLHYEAFHDRLTKLRNRAFFMDTLNRVMGADPKPQDICTILYLDLDGFKLINDSLGHHAGDHLLVEASKRLEGCIRSGDVLARIGGDEFAILLEASGLQAGVEIAEQIVKTLQKPIWTGTQKVFTSCSIGIAQAVPHSIGPGEFLRNADIAMYEAKKRGSGGYAVYTASMHADVVAALASQTDLRHAVSRGEFELHYQPICNPADGYVCGMEALIRWRHPERGLINPADFVPLAEEIGLVREIGRYVLGEACRQLSDWQRRFDVLNLDISVNVSGDELRDPTYVAELEAVLAATEIDPSRLQLEITEGVFLRHPEFIGRILDKIRALGVRIALDDFGTGFSSLSYIDQFNIDAIKIDRSFIVGMLSRRRTLAIVETIMSLGRTLGLRIIAEGVETAEQLETLKRLRCGYAQGYLFSQAMPASDMELYLERVSTSYNRTGAGPLQSRLAASSKNG